MWKKISLLIGLSILTLTSTLAGDAYVASLRETVDLTKEPTPPAMGNVENSDVKRHRAYPMQPPTIPHKIDNYQVDTRANKCMACHGRSRTEESQAPMVSVTHFMNRDGNFLAEISPRRYFCNQCHVVQLDVKPIVESEFIDVHTILLPKEK